MQYTSRRPIDVFDVPMEDFIREPGLVYYDYDDLYAEVSDSPDGYWIARIYGDDGQTLEAYVRFSLDSEAVHHYVLDLPCVVIDVEPFVVYLRAESWNRAYASTWIRRIPISEYNAYIGTGTATDVDMTMAMYGC